MTINEVPIVVELTVVIVASIYLTVRLIRWVENLGLKIEANKRFKRDFEVDRLNAEEDFDLDELNEIYFQDRPS
mgnify:CR=1 FL=1